MGLGIILNHYRSSWPSSGPIVIIRKHVRTRAEGYDITPSPNSRRLHESSHGLKRGGGLFGYYGVSFYHTLYLLSTTSLITLGMPMVFHCLRKYIMMIVYISYSMRRTSSSQCKCQDLTGSRVVEEYANR